MRRAASRRALRGFETRPSVESSAHGLTNSPARRDPVGGSRGAARPAGGHPVWTEHEHVRHEGVTLAQGTQPAAAPVEVVGSSSPMLRSHCDRRRVGERGDRRAVTALHLVGDARLLQAAGRYTQGLHGLMLANRRQRPA